MPLILVHDFAPDRIEEVNEKQWQWRLLLVAHRFQTATDCTCAAKLCALHDKMRLA